MKKIYLINLVVLTVAFSACSKDILKPFEDRIVGSWYISDVNRLGLGGSSSEIRFREGSFQFNSDGTLNYIDDNGIDYRGSWDIQKRTVDNHLIRTLQITVVDFNSESVLSEFYDDMNFRSTNHFVAKVTAPFRTYVTHFRR